MFGKIMKLILLGSLVCVSATALCQEGPEKDFDLKFTTSLTQTYDDNITYVKEDKESDFITTLSAGVTAHYETELKKLDAGLTISEDIFARHSNFTKTSEDLFLNYSQELSKYDTISLRENFIHTYDPINLQETFGRTLGRYSHYANMFALEYARELSERMSARTYYSNELDRFSHEGTSNSYYNKIGAALDYSLDSSTVFSFIYESSHRSFSPGDSAWENTLATGIKHSLTKQLYATTKVGVDFINSFSDKTYIKPLFSASLVDEVDEKTVMDLTFTKEYSTNAYTQDVFNNWSVSASWTRELWKNLSATIGAFYGEGDYVSINTRDTFMGSDIGLNYRLSRNLKLRMAYLYSRSNSNQESREYAKNAFIIGVILEF